MEYILSSPHGRSFVEKHGDVVWEDLCDELPVDAIFSRKEVAEIIQNRLKVNRKSAENYAHYFIANLVATPEGGLFRVGRHKLRFHDTNGH